MSHLIKDEQLVENEWTLIAAGQEPGELPSGQIIVPLAVWLERRDELLGRADPLAVWLDSDQHPEALADDLSRLAMIAVNFPVFSDGRGYSSARILRDAYGYGGELRAIGDVLRDQLFLMRRCGFDSFLIRADRDPAQALSGLHDFHHVYQNSTMNPEAPLLLRV